MTTRFSISAIISLLLIMASCSIQEPTHEQTAQQAEGSENMASKKAEPHRYGGWYCPDNFGFVPVDIQKLDEVPAIMDRLPTEQELRDNKSLINVDTEKYPDARALAMELPRLARIYSGRKGMSELVIVIQAIVVSEDSIVGYRFPNGGNGSAWLSDVTFLSEEEVTELGAQPFVYSTAVLDASKEEIWKAITKTNYFKQLGAQFGKQEFFSSEWTSDSEAYLNLESDEEKAVGYVGTVFGNAYLQIDYDRGGLRYSFWVTNPEQRTFFILFIY
jgi:hypothetical protein